MNQKEKRIMWTSILAPILIVMGVTLLVLGSLPMKNTIEENTLTVNFVIGKKVIHSKTESEASQKMVFCIYI